MRALPVLVVDTNVFLRFFTEDDLDMAERAASLFRQADGGTLQLLTFPLVIAEIVWTLESHYEESRERIREVVETILRTRNFRVAERAAIEQAIAWYADRRVDFVDAYLAAAALAAGHSRIATFDRDFRRLPGVTPHSP